MARNEMVESIPLKEFLGISQPTQEILLATIDGLPPLEYWGGTDDQRELFKDTKSLYQMLKFEMARYFEGEGSKIPLLPEGERERVGALRRKYLAWYSVVQLGWEYISHDLDEIGYSLSENGINTPLDALTLNLQMGCAVTMKCGNAPYERFSPSAERNFEKLRLDIERGDRGKKKIDKYNAIAKAKNRELKPYMALLWKMIRICEEHSQYDRTLERELKAYKIAAGDVDRASAYFISRRQGLKGEEWRHGERRPLARG